MSVSRWERGTQEPSSEILIMLGNMCAEPDNWYFWRAAGLSPKAISGLKSQSRNHQPQWLSVTNSSIGEVSPNEPLVPVSLLNVSVGAEAPLSKQIAGEVESVFAAPKAWCPNPAETVCIHIAGDVMAPLIADGSIVAVDTSENDADTLRDKLVIAQHSALGLVISRLQAMEGALSLTPENARYPSIPYSNRWKICAKVLWWIAFPDCT
jgi:phage repressor protein C with HTH and peptisase S24 domain